MLIHVVLIVNNIQKNENIRKSCYQVFLSHDDEENNFDKYYCDSHCLNQN